MFIQIKILNRIPFAFEISDPWDLRSWDIRPLGSKVMGYQIPQVQIVPVVKPCGTDLAGAITFLRVSDLTEELANFFILNFFYPQFFYPQFFFNPQSFFYPQ